MEENRSVFFQNRECEYFPCHKGIDPEQFNCVFCYCPLYTLGDRCRGAFSYLPDGTKDCSGCMIPHGPEGVRHVASRFPELAALARRRTLDEN